MLSTEYLKKSNRWLSLRYVGLLFVCLNVRHYITLDMNKVLCLELLFWSTINYYLMTLSMISWIIKTEVCVICQSRRLRQIKHRHEGLIIHDIMRKPNSIIIVLLYIFRVIHPQKQKRSVQPFRFWEHSKGLSNQADIELDMINVISALDITFIMSSSQAIVNWLNALNQSDFS